MEQPPDQSPFDVQCETVPPRGKAAGKLKLAAIFIFIASGLHVVGFLLCVFYMFFLPYVMANDPAVAARPMPFPIWVFSLVYGIMAFLALCAAIICFIAGRKLLRGSRGAFGWGLAAGIVCCLSLWCSLGCVLPAGAGIYTIVILCFEDVRAYLRESGQGGASTIS